MVYNLRALISVWIANKSVTEDKNYPMFHHQRAVDPSIKLEKILQ